MGEAVAATRRASDLKNSNSGTLQSDSGALELYYTTTTTTKTRTDTNYFYTTTDTTPVYGKTDTITEYKTKNTHTDQDSGSASVYNQFYKHFTTFRGRAYGTSNASGTVTLFAGNYTRTIYYPPEETTKVYTEVDRGTIHLTNHSGVCIGEITGYFTTQTASTTQTDTEYSTTTTDTTYSTTTNTNVHPNTIQTSIQ